jgi:hypothetical protein
MLMPIGIVDYIKILYTPDNNKKEAKEQPFQIIFGGLNIQGRGNRVLTLLICLYN